MKIGNHNFMFCGICMLKGKRPFGFCELCWIAHGKPKGMNGEEWQQVGGELHEL
tara:strand:+ start:562 stop:723 length:162 start_codon:yes stop_codon:yes gene_type:complete